jgi:hypothetical protein
MFPGFTTLGFEIPTELMPKELAPLPFPAVLELAVELERLVRDPKVLGLVETELRLPLLGFAMLRRDMELEGETTFVLPDINFWGFENLKV